MARIRHISPEFFLDEDLASLPAATRLMFVGLWTLADREGRLEDRPRRIGALLFPYDDDANPEYMLASLAAGRFIRRYMVEGRRYIQIRAFAKHQHPHPKEAPSEIPAPLDDVASGPAMFMHEPSMAMHEPSMDEVRSCLADVPSMHEHPSAARPGKAGASPSGSSDLSGSSGSSDLSGSSDVSGSSAETAAPSSPPHAPAKHGHAPRALLPAEPALLTFPCDGPQATWALTQRQTDEWGQAFPSLDVLAQCRQALAWVQAKPANRKTAGGMARFLVGWLGRAQNGGAAKANGHAPGRHTAADERVEHSREALQRFVNREEAR